MAIDFAQIGILTGVAGVPIDSPTSIQFGPDGRYMLLRFPVKLQLMMWL